MSGRYLAAPLLVACFVVAARLRSTTRLVTTLSFLALLALGGVPFAVRMAAGGARKVGGEAFHGIWDERAQYYPMLGLFSPTRIIPEPEVVDLVVPLPDWHTTDRPAVLFTVAAGIPGYVSGPRVHLIDPLLVDPLLARLPARDPTDWSIGHVLRRIPEGYIESVFTGENRILHPGLRRFYEQIRLAVRAPLSAPGRLGAIWGLLIGSEQDGLRQFLDEHYYKPPLVKVRQAELGPTLPDKSPRDFANGQRAVYAGGLEVAFDAPVERTHLLVGLDSMDTYALEFRRGEHSLGSLIADTGGFVLTGIRREELVVPEKARRYDHVRFFAVHSGDGIVVLAYCQPTGG